ncbi:MAG: ATP-binding protein [Rubrivivax sp.]
MLVARFAPSRIVAVGAILAVALFVLDIGLASSMPWLGLEFDAPAAGSGLVIARVFQRGPADGLLKPGERVTAVETRSGALLPLDAGTISRATYGLSTYEAYNRFFADHRALWDALSRDAVTFVRADGTRAVLHPQRQRPAGSLPADFWAMDLLAAIALLIGIGVLAFGPRDIAARIFFVACLAMAPTAAILALGKGRELSFDADWVRPLWALEQFGEHLALFGLVALLWVYPRRLGPTRYLLPMGALFGLAWLAGHYQWWPSPRTSRPLTMSAVFCLGLIPLSVRQWRLTERQPVERAALKALLLATLVPVGLWVFANRLPMLLGLPPLVVSGVGEAALFLLLFAGMALGVARYRLFNLDRWWFAALVWALGGALVVLLDGAMLWLNASAGLALGAALAVAGWLYFPLRQWLWQRISPGPEQTLERHLPQLIDSLFAADSSATLQAHWRRLLDRIYAPLSIGASATPVDTAAVAREGLVLRIPGLGDAAALELQHAAMGRRLFTPADAALAAALLALTQQAARARRAQDGRAAEHQARLHEKELLMQDLHDGLGGMATNIGLLVSLAQQERDPAELRRRLALIGELADASLSEIRGFMYGLESDDADWPAIAADLRAQGRGLVEPHGLGFEMQAAVAEAVPPPDSLTRLNLQRICKEALMNVVKHARARHVLISLEVTPRELRLAIQDDGIGLPPQRAEPARQRGLTNLQRRAERLQGRVLFGAGDDGVGTAVRLTLPLPTKCPASGDDATTAAH